MTTALAVANTFIQLAARDNAPISNMKLQKLVYFAQGFYAAFHNGAPLFNDEIQAWKYGPVIPELYHKFKIYFAGPIPPGHPYQVQEPLNANELAVVNWVYANLGRYTAVQLSDFSHAQGSPWHQIFTGTFERDIPVNSMTDYFKGLVQPTQRAAPVPA
jgi:uncharacterized phage-associated protein